MIDSIKSFFNIEDRPSPEEAEAERVAQEAATEASNQEAIARAEELMATAQTRRDRGDRIGASIYYAEAITLLRNADLSERLAYALRHAAEVRSELGEYAVAAAHIQDAIRLYRATPGVSPLDLANALRVSALTDEREARASWTEARELYRTAGVAAGVSESSQHLEILPPDPTTTPPDKEPLP